VEVAAEAHLVLEGVVDEELLEVEVLLAEVAGLAFVVELDALGVGGAGEGFEAAHLGAGEGGVGGGGGYGGADGDEGEEGEAAETEAAEEEEGSLGSAVVGAEAFE
jgi:hypothetical protein